MVPLHVPIKYGTEITIQSKRIDRTTGIVRLKDGKFELFGSFIFVVGQAQLFSLVTNLRYGGTSTNPEKKKVFSSIFTAKALVPGLIIQ